MTAQQLPVLPTELWIRILKVVNEDEDELTYMWTCIRHVSTAFKEAVETIYLQNHLRKTRVRYRSPVSNELGPQTILVGSDTRKEVPSILDFRFSHVSDDMATAFFKAHIETNEGEGDNQALIPKEFQDYINHEVEKEQNILFPLHTVKVRYHLTDSPIPERHLDLSKKELACDWRGLFSVIFSEEKLVARTISSAEDHGEREGAFSAKLYPDIRKQARRRRIKWQLQQLHGKEWDPERDGDVAGYLAKEEHHNKMLAAEAVRASSFGLSYEEFIEAEDGDFEIEWDWDEDDYEDEYGDDDEYEDEYDDDDGFDDGFEFD